MEAEVIILIYMGAGLLMLGVSGLIVRVLAGLKYKKTGVNLFREEK